MSRITLIIIPILIAVITLTLVPLNAPTPAAAAPDAIPQRIDYGSHMAANDTHIYYAPTVTVDLLCLTPDQDIYGRVPHGGGPASRQRLAEGCSVPRPRGAMAVDDTHVYFTGIQQTLNNTVLYRRSLDGSGANETLYGFRPVQPRALALDDDFVYFASVTSGGTGAILRVDKATTDLEEVTQLTGVHAATINGLAVDNTYIYWTEGRAGVDGGNIKRARKDGTGNVELIGQGDAPYDIFVTLNHLYWSELDGERVVIAGKNGQSAIPMYEGNYPIWSIFVSNTMLVFAEGDIGPNNGAIRRMGTLAGGESELMLADLPCPCDVAHIGDYVYWVDGSFHRIHENATTAEPDYVVTQLELTQGVQDGANSVPFVTFKPTIARVYAHQAAGDSAAPVTAVLHVYSANTGPLPGSPLSPMNGPLDLAGPPSRGQPHRTFNFELPEHMVTNPLIYWVELNPGGAAYENNFVNNAHTAPGQPYTFAALDYCLVTYSAPGDDGNGGGSYFVYPYDGPQELATYLDHMNRAKTLIPAVVWLWPRNGVYLINNPDGTLDYFNLSEWNYRHWLLGSLAYYQELTDPPSGCAHPNAPHVGLAGPDSLGGALSGWGKQGDAALYAIMTEDGGANYNEPFGGVALAQAAGIALSQYPVDCDNPLNVGDPGYPYPPCQIDDSSGQQANWGYDLLTGRALNPLTHADLLAFRNPRWISAYTWRNMHEIVEFNEFQALSPLATAQPPEKVLSVRGRVDDGGAFTHDYYFGFEFPNLTEGQIGMLNDDLSAEPPPSYEVQLRNSRGSILHRQPVPLDIPSGDPADGGLFSTLFPYDDNTAEVRLVNLRDGATIFSRAVSPNAPRLTVNPPVVDDDIVEISWNAQDADGDDLRYIVQYIYGRDRKIALAVDHRDTQLSFTTRDLPGGGPAFVRVYASDGVNTTYADSARFDVDDHPPLLAITHPRQGDRIIAGAANAISYRASLWDNEDGARFDRSRVRVTLDGQPLYSGLFGPIPVGDPGEHTLTVTATDSAGNRAQSSVTFTVENPSTFLPLLFR